MLAERRESLRTGRDRRGAPLDDEQRGVVANEIADLEGAIAQWQHLRVVPSSVTFDDVLHVSLGRRRVDVMHLGRGNTAGDAVVYVPDAKTLMTGDLVVYPTPYAFGSYLGEWTGTLRKLMAIDAATIVPGHGPVQHDFEYVKLVASALDSVTRQVRAAVQEGLSLDETRARVDLTPLRARFAGASLDRARAFHDAFEKPAVERAYEEAKGKLSDE